MKPQEIFDALNQLANELEDAALNEDWDKVMQLACKVDILADEVKSWGVPDPED